MHKVPDPTLHAIRRKPLAACATALFALAAPAAAIADTWTVNSCDGDSFSGNTLTKTGTLRFVVASGNAVSGDTVDLSGLTGDNACSNSKISLTTGSLIILQQSLELLGPAEGLTLDSSGVPCESPDDCYGRTIEHDGAGGLLYLKHVNVSGGYEKRLHADAMGGCIFSNGDVKLKYSNVSTCKVHTTAGSALGGGIYAQGKVTANESLVSGNVVLGGSVTKGGGVYAKGDTELDFGYANGNTATSTGDQAKGGGIYTLGKLTVSLGSLSNNAAIGKAKSYGGGACVIGEVTANSMLISGNTVNSTTNTAYGGGLFAVSPVDLQQSIVTGNNAGSTAGVGGGVMAKSGATISYSTVSDNTASGPSRAGGLLLYGNSNSITGSTISGNHALSHAGIEVFSKANPASLFQIANSTISGNVATYSVGGIYVDSATTKFYNSTIAFNTAPSAPGVLLSAQNGSMQAMLQSTLMSNNTTGSSENDLSTVTDLGTVTFNGGLTGQAANNLIYATSVSGLPTDTKKGQCPLLGVLRDNGGLTWTHALLSKSPAIDTGNYKFGGLDSFDERGKASVNGSIDYVRVSGLTTKADIGSYEVQHDDIVFSAGNDGCPAP